jgi:hypothetical protein
MNPNSATLNSMSTTPRPTNGAAKRPSAMPLASIASISESLLRPLTTTNRPMKKPPGRVRPT